jgi:hypothetical protein
MGAINWLVGLPVAPIRERRSSLKRVHIAVNQRRKLGVIKPTLPFRSDKVHLAARNS